MRAPSQFAISQIAPSAVIGTTESAAGCALTMFPASVAMLRICGEPTLRQPSESAGNICFTDSLAAISA